MIKGLDNLPLSRVQFLSGFNSPPKNHMKISNHKFPHDFFKLKATKKLYLSSPLVRNQPQTQQQSRMNGKVTPLKMQIQKRQNLTARNSRENDEDLIMGVISTTRQMKKIIRKHSLELKKESKGKKFKLDLELPPLILRKGVATAN